MDAEREGPAYGRGKWGDPRVPKRGWRCETTLDLEEPSRTCEMCESVVIRYVHVMRHPDYPDDLECGCICAGHMEEDVEAARKREGSLKKRTARKSSWPTLKGWRRSRSGNWTIRKDGIRVTVIPAGIGYKVAVTVPQREEVVYGRHVHGSAMAAREASFVAYEWSAKQPPL